MQFEAERKRFPNDDIRLIRRLARGGGLNFVGIVLGHLASLVLHMLLARVLGARGYGLYSLGMSVVVILQPIALFGMEEVVIRFGGLCSGLRDYGGWRRVLLLTSAITLILGILIGFILAACAVPFASLVFAKSEAAPLLFLLAFSVPLYSLLRILGAAFRSLGRFVYDIGLRSFLFPACQVVLSVGLSYCCGARGAAIGYLLALVVIVLLGGVLLRRDFPRPVQRGQISKFTYRGLLQFAISALIIGFSQQLLVQADKLVLGRLVSAEELGVYVAAFRVANQSTLGLMAVEIVFAPMCSSLFGQGNWETMSRLLKVTTRWAIMLSIPIFCTLTLVPRDVMYLLFGTEYTLASSTLTLLALVQMVKVSVGPIGYLLMMTGKQDIELFNSLSVVFLNLVLNLLLTVRYGITGAAIATLVSVGLVSIARLLEVRALRGFWPYDRQVLGPFLAGGVALVSGKLVGLLPWASLARIPVLSVMVFVYIGLIVWKCLTNDDRMLINAIRRKLARVALSLNSRT